jgi:hypothetical protein
MADITFCRPVHNYESYADFWQLVSLSGFPIISVSDLDISKDGIYVTAPMNGDWREHLDSQAGKPRYAHLILWNLERPAGSTGYLGQYIKSSWNLLNGIWETQGKHKEGDRANVRFIDEIWVSDAKLADEVGPAVRFVPLGSDEGLGSPSNEKQYDFCHMSYLGAIRRPNIYKHFRDDQIGPNGWGNERDEVLKRSRFALNVHQDNYNFQEPLRFALFAAYGLPIISEDLFNMYPWSNETMITTNYYNLVGKLREVLTSDYEPYRQMGLRARERMAGEFQFGKMVRQAIEESVNRWR